MLNDEEIELLRKQASKMPPGPYKYDLNRLLATIDQLKEELEFYRTLNIRRDGITAIGGDTADKLHDLYLRIEELQQELLFEKDPEDRDSQNILEQTHEYNRLANEKIKQLQADKKELIEGLRYIAGEEEKCGCLINYDAMDNPYTAHACIKCTAADLIKMEGKDVEG
jgi:hypothetical protein